MDFQITEVVIRREKARRPGFEDDEALALAASFIAVDGQEPVVGVNPRYETILLAHELPMEVLDAIEAIADFLETQARERLLQQVQQQRDFQRNISPIKRLVQAGKVKKQGKA